VSTVYKGEFISHIIVINKIFISCWWDTSVVMMATPVRYPPAHSSLYWCVTLTSKLFISQLMFMIKSLQNMLSPFSMKSFLVQAL